MSQDASRSRSAMSAIAPDARTLDAIFTLCAQRLADKFGFGNSSIDHVETILAIGYQFGLMHGADKARDWADILDAEEVGRGLVANRIAEQIESLTSHSDDHRITF